MTATRGGAPCRSLQDLTCDIFERRATRRCARTRARSKATMHSLGHGVGLAVHEGRACAAANRTRRCSSPATSSRSSPACTTLARHGHAHRGPRRGARRRQHREPHRVLVMSWKSERTFEGCALRSPAPARWENAVLVGHAGREKEHLERSMEELRCSPTRRAAASWLARAAPRHDPSGALHRQGQARGAEGALRGEGSRAADLRRRPRPRRCATSRPPRSAR